MMEALREEYKKILSECLNAFGIKISDIKIVFSEKLYGGKLITIGKFSFAKKYK